MSALAASIALSSSSITVGQVLNAVLTITNSSATPINISNIQPQVYFTGNPIPMDGSSYAASVPPLSQGFQNVVPASGSATFSLSYAIYQPSTGLNSNDYDMTGGTYSVTANISAYDGEYLTPTPATVTVNPVLPLF